ncbi:ankyrin repeat domain-containing protein [Roseovarius arcticus]|uniref:ankyrin repeat domain-containing protein n=1 Tax=Roseovarius arcticus TaxID=2547404 RepID=UPI0011109D32|nr:ankyrin repeat domain-containing protein [Roseovarius arcticus]
MPQKSKTRETLEELLASCSDTFSPAELGSVPVTLDGRDVDGETPLHVMLWRGNTYAVLQFIEAGADINAVGDMAETPLHIAVKQQNSVAIEALLKAGAGMSHVSEFRQSPRELADELGGDIRRLFVNQ